MYIGLIVGILSIWMVYSIATACIRPTPVIKDKNRLLRDLCGKSQSECKEVLKQYKR